MTAPFRLLGTLEFGSLSGPNAGEPSVARIHDKCRQVLLAKMQKLVAASPVARRGGPSSGAPAGLSRFNGRCTRAGYAYVVPCARLGLCPTLGRRLQFRAFRHKPAGQ